MSQAHERRNWIASGVVGVSRGKRGKSEAHPTRLELRLSAAPRKSVLKIAQRLLEIPTAPGHEHAVREEVLAICRQSRLEYDLDRFGNVFIRLNRASGNRPLVLAAHMDHPGFKILGQIGDREWQAKFLGGVPDDHFRKGLAVRLMPGGIPARVARKLEGKEYVLRTAEPMRGLPQFAVWDVEPCEVRQRRLLARACDDLVGCASVLATLIELKRRRAKVNVIGVLSRAEEVGFYGALALASERELPKKALVISLETSKEMPPVSMGKGVILRVGDRASTFDSGATRFLAEVAAEVQKADPQFQFQRALMSGGTCEATAYQEYGYISTGVCVALGNYHNCGPQKTIQAEFVSLDDVEAMVQLLVAAALEMPRYRKLTGILRARLEGLLVEARKLLIPALPKLRRPGKSGRS